LKFSRYGFLRPSAAVHLDHFRCCLQAEYHLVRLVAEDDPFLFAGDLIHVARISVIRHERNDGDDRGNNQPGLKTAAALAAACAKHLPLAAVASVHQRPTPRQRGRKA